MAEKVRVGLIGCGGIAGRHVDWFLRHPDAEITVLCDVSSESIANKRDMVTKLRPDASPAEAGDYRDVLAGDEVDAVAVLLPHDMHHSVTMAALDSGKHVLVEKPMACSSAEAREMRDKADVCSLVLCLGYQRSFLPEYVYVRRMIERGDMGKVRFITAHLEQSWYAIVTEGKGGKGWKSDPKQAGGGQLVDTGSHTLAALLDVTRLTPCEVFATMDNCGLPVDVNTSMVIRFAEGAQAAVTIGGFGHKVTESIRVVGEEKSARIFFRTVKEQALEVDGEAIDAPSLISPSTPNANFVDAILGRNTVVADGTLGMRVMQVSEAAYASAKENRPIAIQS